MAVVALLAAAARVPGALWPVRPDEAGFTLVARSWNPRPDSMFGHYWVDRPPLLIALVRAADAIGGPLFLRLVAAVGCGLLVVGAAAVAREIARRTGCDAAARQRAAAVTAVGTAALTSNAMIDLVAAKGEVLALPLLVTTFWLALRMLAARSASLGVATGLVGASALGLKQNLIGGLAFAGLLLVGELITRRVPARDAVRLAAGVLGGAIIPVAATVGCALAAGVRLSTLWYAVVGFRSDASRVIWSQPASAPLQRAQELVVIFVATGLVVVVGWFVISLRRLIRAMPTLAFATGGVLLLDLAGVALGGSYWRPYLFGLVPSAVLILAMLSSGAASPRGPASSRPTSTRPRRTATAVTVVLAASSLLAGLGWGVTWARGGEPPTEVYTGEAIRRAAWPDDTLVVFGGRADIQLTAGMPSPYPFLWSLPARVLDPGSRRLARLLAGPHAPTWFVVWVPLDAWDPASRRHVDRVLARRYAVHGNACNGHPVYLLRGVVRPSLRLGCTRPYRPRPADDVARMGPGTGRTPGA